MKIALVTLGVGTEEFSQFSKRFLSATVALYYLGMVLEEAGFEVKILDQPNTKLLDDEIIHQLMLWEPQVILFAQFFTTRKRIKRIIRQIRRERRGSIIGVGGHDATFHSLVEPQAYKLFDVVFQGPVIKILAKTLERLKTERPLQTLFFNTLGQTEDPDKLPILAHDNYSGTGFIVGSFGCYKKKHGCYFCTTPQFSPTGWRPRSVEAILVEARNLKEKGNKEYFFLTDDDALVDVARGNRIILGCQQIGPPAMMLMSKPQWIEKASKKKMIGQWHNVKRIFLGLENGSLSGLRELGKRTGNGVEYLQQCAKAYNILKDNQIAAFTGHINFTGPQTSFLQLRESTKFLYQLGECDWTALSQAWRPYPGTIAFERFEDDFWLKKGEYVYGFKDPRVEKFYLFVLSLREKTDRMDNLIYYLTDEIYLQSPPSNLWEWFWKIKSKWNELVYQFFFEFLQRSEKRERLMVDDFLKEMRVLIEEASQLEVLLSRG